MDRLQRILSHSKVVAIRDFENNRKESLARVFVKAFDDGENPFPIDFDVAWEFAGYSNKASALRKLKSHQFLENEDYKKHSHRIFNLGVEVFNIEVENLPSAHLGGRPTDKYFMTTTAFEHFAMSAPGEKGKLVRGFFIAIRDAYLELAKRSEVGKTLGDDLEEAYMKTLDNTACFYMGLLTPDLCKFGITENLRRRVGENKRAFSAVNLEFRLINAWAASQHRRVETAFKSHPVVRDNITEMDLPSGKQTELVKFSSLFKKEHAVEIAKKLAMSLSLDEMSWNDQVEIEREREKTKRAQIEAETRRFHLQLAYSLKSRKLDLAHRVSGWPPTVTEMQIDTPTTEVAADLVVPQGPLHELWLWIGSACRVDKDDPTMQTPTADLYEQFVASRAGGTEGLRLSQFGKMMAELGFSNNGGKKAYFAAEKKQARVIQGIALVESTT